MLLTVQVAVSCPAHDPLQLAKLKLAAGVAVMVTVLPALPVMVHAAPLVVQLVGVALASLAVTEPLPPLAAEIDSVMGTKFAVELAAAWGSTMVQVAVCPAHEPLQLPNTKLAAGLVVMVTVSAPAEVMIVHAAPEVVQLGGRAPTLGSLAVTEPLPPLAALTLSMVAAWATADGAERAGTLRAASGIAAARLIDGTAKVG